MGMSKVRGIGVFLYYAYQQRVVNNLMASEELSVLSDNPHQLMPISWLNLKGFSVIFEVIVFLGGIGMGAFSLSAIR